MTNQEFLMYFMNREGFPEEARNTFEKLYKRILDNFGYKERMNHLIFSFMKDDIASAFSGIDELARDLSVSSYTMSMLLLLLCCKPLCSRYQNNELTKQLYWDTMADLTYKLKECHSVYGIWGTFVREWYPDFYQLARFALGRMQYEFSDFHLNSFSWCGHPVHQGDKVLNMHIPSSGPFSKEVRTDSYHKAYNFYSSRFEDEVIPVVCDSWLLFPQYKAMLPSSSNIKNFMDDFSYIKGNEENEFYDAWRIYGAEAGKPVEDLPEDTSLKRQFKKYLKKGGKTGAGYGIFFLGSEGII